MLELKNIKKQYGVGDSVVQALNGVSLKFRENEFVSILGPSGCGKTTLLNIIGGLDRYTEGDLVINGRSTKDFEDSDWDTYRNHSIGFVFQSYNLIPHQTVLSNVELALTLSGVSKAERHQRAVDALKKVGLGDQLNKKPAQMSGGQMQRVAIARALVNNPDILLADEPTGALDTHTSIQIMEILKEISKERLIIMVTHNPELAEAYSTRIIKVLDGLVTDDSNPYVEPVEKKTAVAEKTKKEAKRSKKKNNKGKKTSMSFLTALSLSFNNLRTKKGRTIMTSFAGSIGIIGIALILALSTGINAFIAQVQEDTLSTYPLTIQRHTQDMSAMLSAMTSVSDAKDYRDSGMIYVDDSLGTMMGAMSSTVENNLEAFKKHIEEKYDSIEDFVSDIQYTYDYDLQVFNVVTVKDENGKEVLEARKVGMETVFEHMGEAFSGMTELMEMSGGMGGMGMNVFSEMINNQEILDQQYDVIAGNWPKEYNEVVLVVNSNNQISKMTMYMLGMLDPNEIDEDMKNLMNGEYKPSEVAPFTYEDIMGIEFKLLTTQEFFRPRPDRDTSTTEDTHYNFNGTEYPIWEDYRNDFGYDETKFVSENGINIKISGIIRPKDGAASTSVTGAIGYTNKLTDYILEQNANSDVINQQKETPEKNVLTGLDFERTVYTRENIQELINKIDAATMDMFYSYMTSMIKGEYNDETNSLLNVTRANISTMFMLLSEEQQAQILEKIINSAYKNNPEATDRVFATMSTLTGGIEVKKETIVTLLPILNKMETMPLMISLGVPGLATLADEAVLDEVIKEINDKHPEFESSMLGKVTRQNLSMMLGRLPAEEQTAAYKKLLGSINEANDTTVSILCGILSSQTGTQITKENLAEKLPTLEGSASMMAPALAIGGMPGFIDYAEAQTMTEIYSEMNALVMNLEVNEKIFSLLLLAMPDDLFVTMEETLYNMAPQIDATYDSVLETLDDAEKAKPAAINFFAKDFESKEVIEKFINDYNDAAEDKDKLEYTDVVGALMSSVTIIVNAISYVLIAFVAISLVVSSIMIGIITNISVLERTKEIGILRAIGASKKDVSRVFNAETLIIGLAAGAIGIISTLLLCIPITAIVQYFTELDNIRAILPWEGAVVLVIISMVLTLIAGIIPSRAAARKDPVEALRSE